MAILALEQDARFGGLGFLPGSILSSGVPTARAAIFRAKIIGARIIDRENDNGTGMADDIAARANAAGFFDFVGGDVEDGSLICDARRQDARLR
jgi:hypothetical protein